MARIFKPRSEATSYKPKADDTFANIVQTKCEAAKPPITTDEVALFNWGTKEPKEILRALVELIGCKQVNEADPTKCKLDPARGPGGGTILLPKVWKKAGLAYEKVHALSVKQQLPATAISVISVDKWFLPGAETCVVAYALEGLHSRALKLEMDVYASNYAKATATNSGEFVAYTYTETPDTPIIQKTIQADAGERATGNDSSWHGESEAADGILKPRAPAKRYINAASSPYTVMLRYYKDNAHKKAILRLASFWPQWTGTGAGRAVVDASLKFKWTLKDCPGGMQGQFQIFDKDGKIVWRQALTPAECGNGDHEHNWAEGKPLVTEAKMPYRVQIQVHTNKDTDPGLGLAGMHTEVRLFTHPDIGTHGVNHEQETQVLKFALAPFYSYNGAAPPEDSAKGRKLRLAAAGYHPGPIEDGEGQAPYTMAVKEFQRDHAKPGVTHTFTANEPPLRLKADGTLNADTKNLIATQAAGRRPLFGTNARADITNETTLNNSLNDKATPIVLWVDDRHNYTKPDPPNLGAVNARNAYLKANMTLEDYHGVMGGVGDIKQANDQTSICRPWIPLEVGLPIMRKSDDLQTANPAVPDVTDTMRSATGPIRVDWTLRDLAPEYKVDITQYNATRVRALQYLTTAFINSKGAHNGKDAFNVTTALGGIRDGTYYKAPFGIKDANQESLMPWEALPDAGVSAVCSVVHDDLGQEDARLYAPRVGKAGVYLHPSIIGGDGYQFRAQVSFRDLPSGSTHPNWKILRDRYDATKLPQAHTAPTRLWRKDSYRAHVRWTAAVNWGTFNVQNMKFYEPAMLHWVNEGTGVMSFRASQVYAGGDGQDAYRKLMSEEMKASLLGDDPKTFNFRPASEMTLTDSTIWPWSSAKHLGVQSAPPHGTTLARYERVQKIESQTWDKVVYPLMMDLLTRIENDHGLLRGHLICDFRSWPQYWKEMYYCSAPARHDQILIEPTAAGGSAVGEVCRRPGCPGVLQSSIVENYRCNQCGSVKAAVSISANFGGTACTTRCTGTFTQTAQEQANWFRRTIGDPSSVNTTYSCNTCGRTITVVEVPANSGSRGGSACGEICPRHGTMQAVPGTRTPQQILVPTPVLLFYSIGGPLGSLLVETTPGPPTHGPRTYWAHENGHHKHLEHAGDKIVNATQHDTASNTVDAVVAADPDPKAANWDRDCIMSYINTETGPDQAYFCGKCLLKLRGWRVEGLADPAGGSGGP